MIPTFPPSGDSVGQMNPHCELCSFLGPNDFDPAGKGVDNLRICYNVPSITFLLRS